MGKVFSQPATRIGVVKVIASNGVVANEIALSVAQTHQQQHQ
jgi:hypothetical protein